MTPRTRRGSYERESPDESPEPSVSSSKRTWRTLNLSDWTSIDFLHALRITKDEYAAFKKTADDAIRENHLEGAYFRDKKAREKRDRLVPALIAANPHMPCVTGKGFGDDIPADWSSRRSCAVQAIINHRVTGLKRLQNDNSSEGNAEGASVLGSPPATGFDQLLPYTPASTIANEPIDSYYSLSTAIVTIENSIDPGSLTHWFAASALLPHTADGPGAVDPRGPISFEKFITEAGHAEYNMANHKIVWKAPGGRLLPVRGESQLRDAVRMARVRGEDYVEFVIVSK